MQCHTVMKTVRCVEYEQQRVTCYKTCWERVCEDRVINCVKYVPETRTREKFATRSASRCWETKTRCYTVCKPVLGNQDPRDLLHGLQAGAGKPRPAATRCASRCWETKTSVCYTVCKPVLGNQDPLLHGLQAGAGKPRPATYTVCKPCWETKTREICYTVCKPVWEDRTRCYTVCKPVLGNQDPRDLLQRTRAGEVHEDDPGSERPLGNGRRTAFPARRTARCVREPGYWTYDPCTCRCCYCPGKCHTVCCQCPPRTCCKKVGSRRAATKEICCTKYVCEPRTKTCCYKVCKMVPEAADLLLQGLQDGAGATDPHLLLQGLQDGARRADLLLQGLPHGAGDNGPAATRSARWFPSNGPARCCWKICKMVPEQRTCCYKVCKMVPEQRTRTCCYKVCHMVPEQRTCCYKVCHMVPEQRTRTVCYTVCKPVCYQKTIQVYEVRAEVRALHGDPLRAALRLQAGSGRASAARAAAAATTVATAAATVAAATVAAATGCGCGN